MEENSCSFSCCVMVFASPALPSRDTITVPTVLTITPSSSPQSLNSTRSSTPATRTCRWDPGPLESPTVGPDPAPGSFGTENTWEGLSHDDLDDSAIHRRLQPLRPAAWRASAHGADSIQSACCPSACAQAVKGLSGDSARHALPGRRLDGASVGASRGRQPQPCLHPLQAGAHRGLADGAVL